MVKTNKEGKGTDAGWPRSLTIQANVVLGTGCSSEQLLQKKGLELSGG